MVQVARQGLVVRPERPSHHCDAQGAQGVKGLCASNRSRMHTVPDWDLECYTYLWHSGGQCLSWSWHSVPSAWPVSTFSW